MVKFWTKWRNVNCHSGNLQGVSNQDEVVVVGSLLRRVQRRRLRLHDDLVRWMIQERHTQPLSTISVSQNHSFCLGADRGPNSGPQKVSFYTAENVARESLSVCPSADTLGSVHSPALRCDHNEVCERLEDIAGTKHVKGRNSLWILKQVLIMLHFISCILRGWQEVTARRVWQSYRRWFEVNGKCLFSACRDTAGGRGAVSSQQELVLERSSGWPLTAGKMLRWLQSYCFPVDLSF